jgi:NAD(P)-dependent dehydrogenase (short-subunit alcohol dehydrogenase family)
MVVLRIHYFKLFGLFSAVQRKKSSASEGLHSAGSSETEPDMSKSDDKIALVTGASRGLGAAVALELANKGYHIIALARTTGALEELDDRIQAAGGSATLTPVDITNLDAMRQICHSIHQRWGHIDLLVHAAIHAAPLTPVAHIDAKDLSKTLAINVTATAELIANTAPLLKAAPSQGRAIFFEDPVCAEKFHATYGASKQAQIALAKAWGCEKATQVKILTPKPMPTATRARFYPGEDRAALTPCKVEAKRLVEQL